MAIAFGGTDFTPPMEVNAIAWIRGDPLDFPGAETTTTREVFRLLGLDPPETSTSSVAPTPPLPVELIAAMLSGLLGTVIMRRRLAQRR